MNSSPLPKIGALGDLRAGIRTDIILVVIPGVGTPTPHLWADGSQECWLRTIKFDKVTPEHFTAAYFDHDLLPNDKFSWQALLSQSSRLLDELSTLHESKELSNCPIVFICHSLGGLILKQALHHIYQSNRLEALLRSISSIIFLGTPHLRSEDETRWQSAELILKSVSSGSHSRPLGDDIKRLATVSTQFEELQVTFPILSVFELRPTRLRRFRLNAKALILVTQKFAETHARLEQMCAVDSDHRDLCHIQGNTVISTQISSFIDSAMDHWRSIGMLRKNSVSPTLSQVTSTSGSDADKIYTPSASSSSSKVSTSVGTFQPTGFDKYPSLAEVTGAAPLDGPQLPCFMMSLTRNPSFFGRSEILDLIEKSLLRSPPGSTETSKTSQNAFALCGPGGIGKTQVATEFVFAHRHDYDAVFWISADEKAKISNAFNQISRNLGLLSSDPMAAHDEASSRDIVKAWLANPMTNFAPSRQQKKLARWLLVFDNVDDPDNLIDFWPSGDSGSILITSRDPLAKSNFSIPSTGIDLRPFSVPESAEILTTLTGRTVLQDEREALSKVATRLGGLPLALTQMAPVIVRRHLSFAEFLQLYEEEDNLSRFHKLKLGIDTTGYEHTLESVWALEALSEEGGKLLALISILDPDNINERILAPTGFPEVEPGYPQDLFTYTAARADLLRSSLISLNSSEKIVSVHRIIQDVTRGKMGEDQLSSTFNEGAKRLWYRWSTDLLGFEFHDVERWRLCETVFSHTLRLKQLYESSSTKFQQHCATFEFAKSLIEAGWYYYERGFASEVISFLDVAQSICNQIKLIPETFEKHAAELLRGQIDIDLTLYCIATSVKDPKTALLHAMRYNEICVSDLSEQDITISKSWNELGVGYMMNLMYSEAIESFSTSLFTLENIKGGYESTQSPYLPMVNLGYAYLAKGKVEEAAAIIKDSLELRQSKYGWDDTRNFVTGRLLHGYGNVKATQGLHSESFELHHRALKQYMATIGGSHHRTADICHKVAEHHARLGENEKAIKMLDYALRIYSSKPNFDNEIARTSFAKGRVLLSMGELDAGATLVEEAIKMFRSLRPKDHRDKAEIHQSDFDELVTFWSQ